MTKKEILNKKKEQLRQKLLKELPPVLSRSEAERLTGRVVRATSLRDLDFRGKGPKEKFRRGRKVVYEREVFVEWFLEECQFECADL